MQAESLLTRSFFERPVLQVAPDLLGCLIEHESADGLVRVRLTEVEAYDGANDPGSHAFRGRTSRNATMFGPAGHVYVYFTYGMHWCMNLVCGPVGVASAVLLRAGEVVDGAALAQLRRTSAKTARDLARGPARLTMALGIDRSHDGLDATESTANLRVLAGSQSPTRVSTGPRVGVAGAGAGQPWRYWIAGDQTVSTYRPAVARRRGNAPPGARAALPDPPRLGTRQDGVVRSKAAPPVRPLGTTKGAAPR